MGVRIANKAGTEDTGAVAAMRVLDIDLDFFLDNIELDAASDGPRLSDEAFTAWKEADVRGFLESCCGLTSKKKIPGIVVVNHHEAFLWWRSLLAAGLLTSPFEVVHVDAHADLGSGALSSSSYFIGRELMHLPVAARYNPSVDSRHMNAGNYLLVAIACEWISKLVFVAHPANRFDDCEGWIFDDDDLDLLHIALPKYSTANKPFPGVPETVLARGTRVEFVPERAETFKDRGGFDFIVLCQSPGFTPASADRLIPVIQDYMSL